MKMRKHSKPPVILEVIGYSGSGKTTLIEKLVPALRKRRISAEKLAAKIYHS